MGCGQVFFATDPPEVAICRRRLLLNAIGDVLGCVDLEREVEHALTERTDEIERGGWGARALLIRPASRCTNGRAAGGTVGAFFGVGGGDRKRLLLRRS